MTLQAAAAPLAVSPSRLRRWADEGRIPCVPHRRAATALPARRPSAGSPPSAACARTSGPSSRPTTALPLLAATSARTGARWRPPRPPRSTATARPAGSPPMSPRRTCATGSTSRRRRPGGYAGALQASEALMRRAHLHAANLLERHAFLERFGQVAVRALVRKRQADGDRRHPAAVHLTPAGIAQAFGSRTPSTLGRPAPWPPIADSCPSHPRRSGPSSPTPSATGTGSSARSTSAAPTTISRRRDEAASHDRRRSATLNDHTEVLEAEPPRRLQLRAKGRPFGTASVELG